MSRCLCVQQKAGEDQLQLFNDVDPDCLSQDKKQPKVFYNDALNVTSINDYRLATPFCLYCVSQGNLCQVLYAFLLVFK